MSERASVRSRPYDRTYLRRGVPLDRCSGSAAARVAGHRTEPPVGRESLADLTTAVDGRSGSRARRTHPSSEAAPARRPGRTQDACRSAWQAPGPPCGGTRARRRTGRVSQRRCQEIRHPGVLSKGPASCRAGRWRVRGRCRFTESRWEPVGSSGSRCGCWGVNAGDRANHSEGSASGDDRGQDQRRARTMGVVEHASDGRSSCK